MRLPHLPPDSCFAAKAWLGDSGLAVGLLGMATEHRWAVWIAVGLMGSAFLLRFADETSRGPRG